MTTPDRERPSTYFVQERNGEELARLMIQDRMITNAMGGVLPERPDSSIFRRVLDIGCGSGSWVIEAAQVFPTMSLFGIDISKRMIEYARTQAKEHQVSDRVEFQVMDALLLLEFPPEYFDLVNLRFGLSFMRTWDWPKMLSEMQRMVCRGGVVLVTDTEVVLSSTSPALKQWQELFLCALFRAGHLFEQETTGLTAHLAQLLKQHGCKQVQTKAYPLTFQAGTPEGQAYYEDVMHLFRTSRPFLKKWGCMTEDYDALYQHILDQMQSCRS
jgi:ubiquinone/menaquinone biosynthesis C-methylase UbiE